MMYFAYNEQKDRIPYNYIKTETGSLRRIYEPLRMKSMLVEMAPQSRFSNLHNL